MFISINDTNNGNYFTTVSQKFCNIIHASLQSIYHMTKAIKAIKITHCGYCGLFILSYIIQFMKISYYIKNHM